MSLPAWFLVGPTAAGKSAVAQRLAERRGALVISADSMLVYRGMDIGTAKPTRAERGSVPYIGLDCVEPDQLFSVGDFLRVVRDALAARSVTSAPILVVGGTGLYVSCLLRGLAAHPPPDPAARQTLEALFQTGGLVALQAELERLAPGRLQTLSDSRNPRRVIRAIEMARDGSASQPWRDAESSAPPLCGLRWAPGDLERRIVQRVEAMYDGGLLEEAAALRRAYAALSDTARQAIGYAEAWGVLDGSLTREQAQAITVRRTRQLAKRQATWFRHQVPVSWVDAKPGQSVDDMADAVEAQWEKHGPSLIQR